MTRAEDRARVLEARYLRRSIDGEMESPASLTERVAKAIAEADPVESQHYWADAYGEIMRQSRFMPSSPVLMNAGTSDGASLAACFVVPIEDDIESIMAAATAAAKIHQAGGGTGFSFSSLRPAGDEVRGREGVAPGPTPWLDVFSTTTGTLLQAGRRPGANMGVLSVRHPDIIEFVRYKTDHVLRNFNLSVVIDDAFMVALDRSNDIDLINPRTNRTTGSVDARFLFQEIAKAAWATGDPGVLFRERLNAPRNNPTPTLGTIETTNPCGEVPLLPWEACILGSLNLSRFVQGGEVDFSALREATRLAVRFLDSAIEVSAYPHPHVEERHRRGNRKIGLGVMGWADLLLMLDVSYRSHAALRLARRLMAFISSEADHASSQLATERGSFGNWSISVYGPRSWGQPMRNATRTAVAPTGSISLIAGCSPSIEPLYALSMRRNVLEGNPLVEINAEVAERLDAIGTWTQDVQDVIEATGSCQSISEIPADVRDLFRTAHEIEPSWHLAHQAAFQQYVDNAVSKTINLPNEATVEDVKRSYISAYALGCKGVTVFRDRSTRAQVLEVGLLQQCEACATT